MPVLRSCFWWSSQLVTTKWSHFFCFLMAVSTYLFTCCLVWFGGRTVCNGMAQTLKILWVLWHRFFSSGFQSSRLATICWFGPAFHARYLRSFLQKRTKYALVVAAAFIDTVRQMLLLLYIVHQMVRIENLMYYRHFDKWNVPWCCRLEIFLRWHLSQLNEVVNMNSC